MFSRVTQYFNGNTWKKYLFSTNGENRFFKSSDGLVTNFYIIDSSAKYQAIVFENWPCTFYYGRQMKNIIVFRFVFLSKI